MAPRANWKGFLRLSLVTCPVALYPATSDTEKISFNQINKKTGHRIRYKRVDGDTGEEVANESLGQVGPAKAAKRSKKATGQKEMLLPIAGKKKEAAAMKPAAKPQRKSA